MSLSFIQVELEAKLTLLPQLLRLYLSLINLNKKIGENSFRNTNPQNIVVSKMNGEYLVGYEFPLQSIIQTVGIKFPHSSFITKAEKQSKWEWLCNHSNICHYYFFQRISGALHFEFCILRIKFVPRKRVEELNLVAGPNGNF